MFLESASWLDHAANLMLNMAEFVTLVILFWYQRNKNKLLKKQLEEQGKVIKDTAELLRGQSVVVDSALKYSEAFDPQKLQEIMRMKVEAEFQPKIEELKRKLSESETARTEPQGSAVEMGQEIAKKALLEIMKEFSQDLIAPLTLTFTKLLFKENRQDRKRYLSEIKDQPLVAIINMQLKEWDRSNTVWISKHSYDNSVLMGASEKEKESN